MSLRQSCLKTCLDESIWIQIILSQLNRLIWKYTWLCFEYKYELTISRLMSLRSCAALFSSQWASSGAESSLSPSVSTCRNRFRALSTNSTPKTACNKSASFIFTKSEIKPERCRRYPLARFDIFLSDLATGSQSHFCYREFHKIHRKYIRNTLEYLSGLISVTNLYSWCLMTKPMHIAFHELWHLKMQKDESRWNTINICQKFCLFENSKNSIWSFYWIYNVYRNICQ